MKKIILFIAFVTGLLSADYQLLNQKYTASEVAQMGKNTGYTVEMINKQGYNTDVDATYEHVYSGGALMGSIDLSAAEAVTIKSSDAKDKRDLRTISVRSVSADSTLGINILGLNEVGDLISENITSNGTTQVFTTDLFEYVVGYKPVALDTTHDIGILDDSGTVVVTIDAGAVADTLVYIDNTLTVTQNAGAGVAYVSGLDGDYEQISERVVLNGTSEVTLENTYLRINEVVLKEAGSEGDNAGAITVSSNTSVMAVVPAGLGVDQGIVYTVPAGKQALISNLALKVISGATPNVRLKYKPYGESWKNLGNRTGKEISVLFPEKTDIVVEVAGSNTSIEGSLDLIVYDQDSIY